MDASTSASGSHRIARVRRALAGCLAMAALSLGAAGAGAAEEALEASVKAAYLYKFLSFVDWPAAAFASADAPQVIGVMGNDELLAELQRIVAGRVVNGHPLVATKVSPGDSVELLHVLYVGRSARAAPAIRAVAGRPVLTVTDSPGGLGEGGILNFVLMQGRVRFEASLPAAERAGVKLSARLLAVAERVVTP